VNDAFLQAQGEEDGIAAYGRMTDLIFAYELAQLR
jgi:hypothetical protein